MSPWIINIKFDIYKKDTHILCIYIIEYFFVQFKKHEKRPWRSDTFLKVAG